MSGRYDCADRAGRAEGIKRAATAVAAGELVVLPTDTVYGLGCYAFSPEAVVRLLTAKGRGRAMRATGRRRSDECVSGVSNRIARRAVEEHALPGTRTHVTFVRQVAAARCSELRRRSLMLADELDYVA